MKSLRDEDTVPGNSWGRKSRWEDKSIRSCGLASSMPVRRIHTWGAKRNLVGTLCKKKMIYNQRRKYECSAIRVSRAAVEHSRVRATRRISRYAGLHSLLLFN